MIAYLSCSLLRCGSPTVRPRDPGVWELVFPVDSALLPIQEHRITLTTEQLAHLVRAAREEATT